MYTSSSLYIHLLNFCPDRDTANLAERRGQQRNLGLIFLPLRDGRSIVEVVEVWIIVFVHEVVWSAASPSTKRVLRAIPGSTCSLPADGRSPGGDTSAAGSMCCGGEGGDAVWTYKPCRLKRGGRGEGSQRRAMITTGVRAPCCLYISL